MPLVGAALAGATVPRIARRPGARPLALVLIADDDPSIVSFLAKVIAREGHEYETAANGREALDLLTRHAFDLVITDINMEDVDGIELILAVREMSATIPVVAISGGGIIGPDSLLLDAGELGADATVAKPFGVDEVRRLLARLLPQDT
jgi:CheY-like chemotaxis protein